MSTNHDKVTFEPKLKAMMNKGFTIVPNSVLLHPTLSPYDKTVYAILLNYAWTANQCFPGQTTVAKQAGMSRRKVISVLDYLEQIKLIKVSRRGYHRTNVYTLLAPPKWIVSGHVPSTDELRNL